MDTYTVSGSEFEVDFGVENGIVTATMPDMFWTLDFEWEHIKRYFEQHGFEIIWRGRVEGDTYEIV